MDGPNDNDKHIKRGGNENKNPGKKKKNASSRRKKRKVKSNTSLLIRTTHYEFNEIENQINEIFIQSLLEQNSISKRGSNATTSIKNLNSVSKHLRVDASKIFLDNFFSNFRLDEPNNKIKNSGSLTRIAEKHFKGVNKPDSMNFFNEAEQKSFKLAKKNKKKKKSKKTAVKSANDPIVEESSSSVPKKYNNFRVNAKNAAETKALRKSSESMSKAGKSGCENNFHKSNNQNSNLLRNEKTSKNEKEQKKSISNLGKSKENAKTRGSERFMEHLLSNEIVHFSHLGLLYSGVIRINQKQFTEAYISAVDEGMDILIDSLIDRNRALEGDEVYYIIKDPSHYRINHDHGELQRTAVVVAIKKKHHNRTAVGYLQEPKKNSHVVTFQPKDARIPKILISKENWPPGFEENPKLFKNKMFYAKINNWTHVRHAEGKILREIGVTGDIDSETSTIMLMFQLNETPYSDALIKTIPPDAATFSSPEIKKREDLRTECVFTIDPATAKDLDDAVSCRLLPNGNYLIGVHISDVTYYLEEGSALDAAALARATTVYLVQKVYHMLPKELCEFCSLTPGTDKLTFSVLWEITPEAEVVHCDFKRSVINCCGQFSYEQVQDIIDNSESISFPILFGPHRRKNVAEAITILNSLAIKLREKRFSNGALKIDQTKISFSLNEKGLPESYSVYINKESHRLIEEFMLLANITVAKRISEDFPKLAFLRSHPPPVSFLLKRLKEKLQKYDIDLDISSSKSLNSSLVRYSGDDPASISRMVVLNALLAKPMNRANYYCAEYCKDENDKKHYALNVDLYTHFTSPIRRYADVVVHRLLAASLGYIKAPDWRPKHLNRIAQNCNQKKYAAKLAGIKSTELFLTIYIEQRGPTVYEAVVYDIKGRSLDCIILDNGLEQRLYFENFGTKSTIENVNGIVRVIIHWPETEEEEKKEQVIDIFSVIKIQLKKSSTQNKLESKLMRS